MPRDRSLAELSNDEEIYKLNRKKFYEKLKQKHSLMNQVERKQIGVLMSIRRMRRTQSEFDRRVFNCANPDWRLEPGEDEMEYQKLRREKMVNPPKKLNSSNINSSKELKENSREYLGFMNQMLEEKYREIMGD